MQSGKGGFWRDLEVFHHLLNYPQVKVGDWKIGVQGVVRDGYAVQTSQGRVKKNGRGRRGKGGNDLESNGPCPVILL